MCITKGWDSVVEYMEDCISLVFIEGAVGDSGGR